MITALGKDANRVIAVEIDKTFGPFQCPECKYEVILKKGRVKVHHFAHAKGSTCVMSEPESQEHMSLKLQIYRDAIAAGYEAQLEKSFDNHRTDCFIKTDKGSYAVEVQLSPIDQNNILDRIKCYQRHGMNTVWVLYDKYQHKEEYRFPEWIRFLHKLHFGSVFFYAGSLQVMRVKLQSSYAWVDQAYDRNGDDVGGYNKYRKTFKYVMKDAQNLIHFDDLSVSFNKNYSVAVCTQKYIPKDNSW